MEFRKNLLQSAVATIIGTALSAGFSPFAMAQQQAQAQAQAQADAKKDIDEVVVTGSRIVRRDLETNSPLMTIDKQQFEDNAYISVEEALNDLPQFMAGGTNMSSGAVTGLQAANGLDGGRGSGDMFNQSLLPDNAGVIGVVVPGAANVNLRGLGANRALVLIDGHRAMPVNASMTVDLNSVPSIAIGGMEVITGGASAVYGADALAGVTNIKFRDKFEGMEVRLRSGINEVGDGAEYQIGTLIGTKAAEGKAHVMVGIEYSKRESALWSERDFFQEVMASPYSGSGNFIFAQDSGYGVGAATGTFNALQKVWSGNPPSQAAVNSVFGTRNCVDTTGAQLACVASNPAGAAGGVFNFNSDNSLYVRSSQVTSGATTTYYGPQGYKGSTTATEANPDEVICTFTTLGRAASNAPFAGQPCSPTQATVDYGRWLSSPRDSYNLFGRGTYQITDKVEAYADFHFAASNTQTRREPAPAIGNGFNATIPFHTSQGDAIYLPSVITQPGAGQSIGQTRSEYLKGGPRGTECAPVGGCTMAQAFPVPAQLRTLLESRPTSNITAATSAFRGLNACNDYLLATNVAAGTQGVQTNPATGAQYIVNIDQNTGQPLAKCGPNSGWQLNQSLALLPARGTDNTSNLYQVAFGFRGDLGLGDWTWDLYGSTGESETQTKYVGFMSNYAYARILSAPNYGKGYSEQGVSSKFLTCTSGLSPFDPKLVVSEDCIDAISANEIDRNSMSQRIFELTTQGHVMNLPAGEVRAALGATHRTNWYQFEPDALRDRDYTTDASPGAFASGKIARSVMAREVYGELLVPLLKDLPLIQSLELELGERYSEYSTGQEVNTYKILGSWAPIDWMRIRGGYNRAERAPNMSELYATPSGSAQFAAGAVDPCRADTNLAATFPGPTAGSTTNNLSTTDAATRQKLQALCAAQINAWGGNNSSDFHSDPNNWNPGATGGALIVGNPDLKNEKGDTWTLGLAFRSPFEHTLLKNITGTVDWYKAKVSDPIEVQQTGLVVNSCFNINGLNPSYTLNDANGFCDLIERDPSTGGIVRVYNRWGNQGELQIKGVDVTFRWSATMEELGLSSLPGSFSVNSNMNFLLSQIQRYGADKIDDYAGFNGASEFRATTNFTYSWGRNRVSLAWNYRQGTDVPTGFAVTPAADGSTSPILKENPLQVGYDDTNLFNLTAGTILYDVNVSVSISNLFDTKPSRGGYDIRDPQQGFGTFSPFDDLVGRRWSLNATMNF